MGMTNGSGFNVNVKKNAGNPSFGQSSDINGESRIVSLKQLAQSTTKSNPKSNVIS
jgi:hypothetical protein